MVRLTPRQKKGVKTSLKTLKRTQIQWIKYWRTKLRRRSSSQKVPRSRSRKLKWFRSRLKPLLRKLRRLRKLTSLQSKNQFLSPKTLKSLRQTTLLLNWKRKDKSRRLERQNKRKRRKQHWQLRKSQTNKENMTTRSRKRRRQLPKLEQIVKPRLTPSQKSVNVQLNKTSVISKRKNRRDYQLKLNKKQLKMSELPMRTNSNKKRLIPNALLKRRN